MTMEIFTIAKDVKNEIVIEKSRFICTLKKVQTEAEAQDFIKAVKKEYWNATHNCSAYLLNEQAQRSSDDGEPSGTAGIPMLEVLRKTNVQMVAAVVTRYFGGVKLGAGGLVRAYTNSVAEAIKKAGRAKRVELGVFVFTVNPNDSGKILNMLYADNRYAIKQVAYEERTKITFLISRDEQQEAEQYLTQLLQMPVELTFVESQFTEIAVEQ